MKTVLETEIKCLFQKPIIFFLTEININDAVKFIQRMQLSLACIVNATRDANAGTVDQGLQVAELVDGELSGGGGIVGGGNVTREEVNIVAHWLKIETYEKKIWSIINVIFKSYTRCINLIRNLVKLQLKIENPNGWKIYSKIDLKM